MSDELGVISPKPHNHSVLRAVGYFLDRERYRLDSLFTVEPGVVISVPNSDPHVAAEAVLLTHEELFSLSEDAWSHNGEGDSSQGDVDPLCPTGCQDFLRALGDMAQQEHWLNLRILRMGDDFLLRVGPARERSSIIYNSASVHALLNHAFARRAGNEASDHLDPTLLLPPSSAPTIPHMSFTGYHPAIGEVRHHGHKFANEFAEIEKLFAARRATDLFTSQIQGGYLFACMTQEGTQEVATITSADLGHVDEHGHEIDQAYVDPTLPPEAPLCTALMAVGQYLEYENAVSAMVQEVESGIWAVNYLGANPDNGDTHGLTKVQYILTALVPARPVHEVKQKRFGLF